MWFDLICKIVAFSEENPPPKKKQDKLGLRKKLYILYLAFFDVCIKENFELK